jgi:hypothetical protein
MQPSDRWYNQPDAIAILSQPDDHYAEELTARNDANMLRLQRLLDADVARICDELQDAIVGPVIDRQRLEEWEESRARDFDVTDEIPY